VREERTHDITVGGLLSGVTALTDSAGDALTVAKLTAMTSDMNVLIYPEVMSREELEPRAVYLVTGRVAPIGRQNFLIANLLEAVPLLG
jgi:hypothetical protein